MKITEKKITTVLKPLRVNIGDYCHVHRWGDKDPNDPFAVGWLFCVMIQKDVVYYQVKAEDGTSRFFKHCEKITGKQGKELMERFAISNPRPGEKW